MTLFVCMHAGEEDVQDFVAWFNDEPIGVFVYKRDSVLYLCVEKETLRKGLRCVSMMKLYLHSSQQRVSELLIHWCRQAWCTKRRLPVHLHGMMRGHSSSPSLWQILHTQQTFNRIPFNMFSLCFLFFFSHLHTSSSSSVHASCSFPFWLDASVYFWAVWMAISASPDPRSSYVFVIGSSSSLPFSVPHSLSLAWLADLLSSSSIFKYVPWEVWRSCFWASSLREHGSTRGRRLRRAFSRLHDRAALWYCSSPEDESLWVCALFDWSTHSTTQPPLFRCCR